LSKSLSLPLVGFDIAGEIAELFLSKFGATSTVESLFLRDMIIDEVINIFGSYR